MTACGWIYLASVALGIVLWRWPHFPGDVWDGKA